MSTSAPGQVIIDAALVRRMMREGIPFCRKLDADLVEVGPEGATARLPYDERLVGNPESGLLHGGVITSLVDTVCGMAVIAALRVPTVVATLDLRIDYLKPAVPGKDLLATAECYKTTRHIAFVRGLAHHGDRDDPVATCAATFMIRSSETTPMAKLAAEQMANAG